MREFQERRKFKRFFKSRYAIAFLVVLVALMAKATYNAYLRYERSEEVVARVALEKADLEAREKALQASVRSLGTPQGVDKEIRSMYGMVREGESLIVVVGSDASSAEESRLGEESWWDRLVDLFKRD
ncbi:MAG: septum formation initiator family protein [Candidatus Paceibacterota bacterium]|jgi:cell division protein FtsB